MLEYLAMLVLFLLDTSLGYVVPLYCTFRSSPTNERWLLHWLAFILASFTVFPFLHWIFSCTTYWVLKVVIEVALLFVLGQNVKHLLT